MTDKPDNKIETFSFEKKDWDDETLTFEQKFLQIRFEAIRVLNLESAGEHKISDRAKKSMKFYNKYCSMAGLEPLDLPF